MAELNEGVEVGLSDVEPFAVARFEYRNEAGEVEGVRTIEVRGDKRIVREEGKCPHVALEGNECRP